MQDDMDEDVIQDSTFLTGLGLESEEPQKSDEYDQTLDQNEKHTDELDNFSRSQSFQPKRSESTDTGLRMSDEEIIVAVERKMREYEAEAKYMEAERSRRQLEKLKARQVQNRLKDIEHMQQEDIQVFFNMVAQHQENFDKTWHKRALEHKIRADDLIDAVKWKHQEEQRKLYEQLEKRRVTKYSVELLNLRRKQAFLAKKKDYIGAEAIKRKADVLEEVELSRIRRMQKAQNKARFRALLQKQEWDRASLANKLHIEKKCLLEAKSQDLNRLKKRLKNAEAELRKTHIRQSLAAESKLQPQYSTLNFSSTIKPRTTRRSRFHMSATARARASFKDKRSARDLAREGRNGSDSSNNSNSARGSRDRGSRRSSMARTQPHPYAAHRSRQTQSARNG